LSIATVYRELNAVLDDLIAGARNVLGDLFVGAYLQGSFAVGDFDEHSDADFVIAVQEKLSDERVRALQSLHGRVYDLPAAWAKHLEGSYFPLATLRSAERCGTPLWYLDHGSRSLIPSNHCNTLVVRCVLRESGITLAGPPPTTLIDPIPVDALRREMHATMRTFGEEILARPEPFRNRFYQGYIVLSCARMLHDLATGRPGSKRAGAEWAKATLDPAWADLIDRAWGGRPHPAVSVRQPADPTDFARTIEFVRMSILASDRMLPYGSDQEHCTSM
jgi:hypothetical protein